MRSSRLSTKVIGMDTDEKSSFPCSECQAGMISRKYITYFTWLGDELVSVPNFPAWVCDICGRREYDHHAVLWLNMLLNPEAGKPSVKFRKKVQPIKKPRPQLRDSKS